MTVQIKRSENQHLQFSFHHLHLDFGAEVLTLLNKPRISMSPTEDQSFLFIQVKRHFSSDLQ